MYIATPTNFLRLSTQDAAIEIASVGATSQLNERAPGRLNSVLQKLRFRRDQPVGRRKKWPIWPVCKIVDLFTFFFLYQNNTQCGSIKVSKSSKSTHSTVQTYSRPCVIQWTSKKPPTKRCFCTTSVCTQTRSHCCSRRDQRDLWRCTSNSKSDTLFETALYTA
jgi:hypothetical protein